MQTLPRVLVWRKSRHSGGGNNCVELTAHPKGVGVRDSKCPEDRVLLSPAAWQALVSRVKAGQLDL